MFRAGEGEGDSLGHGSEPNPKTVTKKNNNGGRVDENSFYCIDRRGCGQGGHANTNQEAIGFYNNLNFFGILERELSTCQNCYAAVPLRRP